MTPVEHVIGLSAARATRGEQLAVVQPKEVPGRSHTVYVERGPALVTEPWVTRITMSDTSSP